MTLIKKMGLNNAPILPKDSRVITVSDYNRLVDEINAILESGGFESPDVQYQMYTDGTTIFRVGVRDGGLYTDKTLTELGFDGEEDTDWENINYV